MTSEGKWKNLVTWDVVKFLSEFWLDNVNTKSREDCKRSQKFSQPITFHNRARSHNNNISSSFCIAFKQLLFFSTQIILVFHIFIISACGAFLQRPSARARRREICASSRERARDGHLVTSSNNQKSKCLVGPRCRHWSLELTNKVSLAHSLVSASEATSHFLRLSAWSTFRRPIMYRITHWLNYVEMEPACVLNEKSPRFTMKRYRLMRDACWWWWEKNLQNFVVRLCNRISIVGQWFRRDRLFISRVLVCAWNAS